MELSDSDVVGLIEIAYVCTWFSATLLLVARPLVEVAFRRWIPPARLVPPRQTLVTRGIILSVLMIPLFLFPEFQIDQHSNSFVRLTETGVLLWVSLLTVWVIKSAIKKGFDLLPIILEPLLTKNQDVAQTDLNIKPYTFANRFKAFLIVSGTFFVAIYSLRYFSLNDTTFIATGYEGFLLLIGEGGLSKPHWLAMAEIFVWIVLGILILFLIIVPLFKNAFKELPESETPRFHRWVGLSILLLGAFSGLFAPI